MDYSYVRFWAGRISAKLRPVKQKLRFFLTGGVVN